MKLRSGLLVAFLLLFSAAVVKANTVPPGDPDVEVGGSTTSTMVGQTFFITIGVNTAQCQINNNSAYSCFDGQNASGVAFQNLLLTFPTPFTTQPPTTCGFQPSGFNAVFSNCTVNFQNQTMFFSGAPGISSTGHFFIAFLGFAPGTTIGAQANVPEPGTLTLFLVGIGALAARRRLRKA